MKLTGKITIGQEFVTVRQQRALVFRLVEEGEVFRVAPLCGVWCWCWVEDEINDSFSTSTSVAVVSCEEVASAPRALVLLLPECTLAHCCCYYYYYYWQKVEQSRFVVALSSCCLDASHHAVQ